MTQTATQSALVIGASKGLGLALAGELVKRGRAVTATVRGSGRTGLHDLADSSEGRLRVESVDTTAQDQVEALRTRLAGEAFDLLFINAAITRGDVPIGEVSTEDFVDVMVTNALSPMRVLEALKELVPPTGTLAIMSSSQGSVSLNTNGGQDLYRASKSALNQLMRSYAARNADDTRTLLLINPGWVRTELGGPDALLSIDQSIPGVVDTLQRHAGEPGLQFLDFQDEVVPW
ncbi:SDR family NAD(P)-dependent oxidoreductase [Mycolicibacterium mengxianglii]|uniref:SDR family NAD(P)-dependent oxidoreductase n=1 Tax=Mycolicibacterium mengxianglii TaxID=2736649 RepID=UPI0018D1E016|nr:SDR family NAD(P)-dependent oxidoreductase [Mycolicibacterium mengxianglii]